jgi:hypothetical protein
MVQINEAVQLKSDAETVWSAIGDFGGIANWHPFLERVDVIRNEQGTVRTAHAVDGGKHVERLEHFDAGDHTYRYRMAQTTMPVRNYTGEFRVDDNGQGTSVVEWSVAFDLTGDADESTVEMVQGFLKAGTQAIKERFDA